MGRPKKEHEPKCLPMYVAGRVKGQLKEKVLKDMGNGKTQQQIIIDALNMLYSSNSY